MYMPLSISIFNAIIINPFTAATKNSHCIKLQLILHHQNNSNILLEMHFKGV